MSKHLVWAGPWHAGSPVALWGFKVVTELLARGNAVDILRTEADASMPGFACELHVQHWSAVDVYQYARRVDAVVVNLADSFEDHGAVVDNLQVAGAFGIIHNASLRQLFIDWACRAPFASSVLQARLTATYGESQKRETRLPLVEWFASGLCGALVHADASLERFRRACPGPVQAIPSAASTPVEHYVDVLFKVLDAALEQRPVIMAGVALGNSLERITMGSAEARDAAERVAQAMRELFRADANSVHAEPR